MGYLTQQERACVDAINPPHTKRMALVSRALQKHCIHQAFGLPLHDIHIERTHKGRPFLNNKLVVSLHMTDQIKILSWRDRCS